MPASLPEQSEASAGAAGWVGWIRRFERLGRQLARHKLAVAAVVGCLVMMLSLGMGLVLFQGQEAIKDAIPRLSQVLERLDAGDDLMATELAQRLRYKPGISEEEITGVAYALGIARARLADRDFGDDQRRGYLVAARFLETVRQRGWPEGREAEGVWHLGKSLFAANKLHLAQPVLERALALWPARATELHQMLAQTCFAATPPALEEAIGHLDDYLRDDGLDELDRQLALIAQAEALFLLDQRQRCLAKLEEVPADSPAIAKVELLRARLLMEEARTLARDPIALQDPASAARLVVLYDSAIARLAAAQERDTLRTQVAEKAMFLLAVCLREKNDPRAALEQFARTVKLHYESPEGLAASFAQAELLSQLGRDEESVNAYRASLERIDPAEGLQNPWLTAPVLSEQLRGVEAKLVEAEQFELAIRLLDRADRVLSPEETTRLRAECYSRWGKALLANRAASAIPGQELQEQGRQRMRQAGAAYLELAHLKRTTREYPEELWNSAEALLAGSDFETASRVLDDYLSTEMRGHRPAALVAQGRALLAQERVDEALKVFAECIERHPRDAANFTARVLAAGALAARDELGEAEQLLLENLEGEYLTPQSPEWRKSLFLLGKLLIRGERYEDAVARLQEAVERYPDDPQAVESHYLLGEALRHLANRSKQDTTAEVAESTRLARAKQAEQYLLRALPHYEAAQSTMDAQRQDRELTPDQELLLRNVHFARGEILFDLGRYAESIDAYSTAVNRSPHTPEVLEAYVQIAECYRRLNQTSEARATIEQAKVVLKRLGNSAPFKETTNYTSEGWVQRLEWLSRL